MYALATLTIAEDAAESSAVAVAQGSPAAILWPGTMTGTEATIQTSTDGETWHTVRTLDGSAAYTIPITAGTHQPLDPTVVYGCVGLRVRLVSDDDEAAARTIRMSIRSL